MFSNFRRLDSPFSKCKSIRNTSEFGNCLMVRYKCGLMEWDKGERCLGLFPPTLLIHCDKVTSSIEYVFRTSVGCRHLASNVVRFLHFWPTANCFSTKFGVTGRASSSQIGSNTDVGLNYLTITFDYLGEKNPIGQILHELEERARKICTCDHSKSCS